MDWLAALTLVAIFASVVASAAGQTNGSTPLRFGQSCALTGRAQALGIGMRNGILAAFEEANAANVLPGTKLELITYDDGYEPEPAVANTRRLIVEDEVFALIGEVGTPTSKVALPVAEEIKKR